MTVQATTKASCGFTDSHGNIVADKLEAANYPEYLGEAVETVYLHEVSLLQALGYPEGMYRVGPLARINLVENWARHWPSRNG